MEKPFSLSEALFASGRVLGSLWPVLLGLSLINLLFDLGDFYLSESAGQIGHRGQLTVAFVVVNLLLSATVANLTSARILGRATTVKQALNAGAARFGALFGTGLLHNILVALGTVALIVPGLVLATRWALYVPVVLFENLSGMAALHRSSLITEGSRWKLFALLLPLFLVPISVRLVGLGLLSGFGSAWLEVLLSYLSECLGQLAVMVMVVVYYQLCPPVALSEPEPLGFSPE